MARYNFIVDVDMGTFDKNGNGSIEKDEFESALRTATFHRPENLEILVQSCDDVEEHLREAFMDVTKGARSQVARRSVTVPALPVNPRKLPRLYSMTDADHRAKTEPQDALQRAKSAPDVTGGAVISVPDVARLMRELLVELGHTDAVIELHSDSPAAKGDSSPCLHGQIESFDTDGDGHLTFDEFFQAYCKFLVRIYYMKKSPILRSPKAGKDNGAKAVVSF